ncbi:MAG: response regulator transcription factor [Anaerolineae bacterium]
MRVLVVDDDIQLASLIAFTLRREGFQVFQAHDGLTALDAWASEQPDIVILDINLPGMSGDMVLQRIRSASATPVIMLTVRGDEDAVVYGLSLGADDYIAKPFSPRNLVARVRAVLRRSGQQPPADLTLADMTLDMDRQAVRYTDGRLVQLTPLEFRLLRYLLVNQGQVLPTDAIIEHVWGYDTREDRTALKQLVRRLRVKIEPDPANPRYIETLPGVGYTINAQPEAVSAGSES